MSRRKRFHGVPHIATVFEIEGDDQVDEFKAVCAAYGLTPKELVHKLVTENIGELRDAPLRRDWISHGIEVLRDARRRRELTSIERSWSEGSGCSTDIRDNTSDR